MSLDRVNSDFLCIKKAWDGDQFNRVHLGGKLTNMVNSIGPDKSFVISIEGDYGTGKSFFLKHWAKHLEEQEYSVIFIDAWQHDSEVDAFSIFFAELQIMLNKLVEQTIPLEDQTVAATAKAAKKAALPLVKKLGPLAVKAVLRKVIDKETIAEAEEALDPQSWKDLEKLGNDELKKAFGKIESFFSEETERQKNLSKFRRTLGDTLKELMVDRKGSGKDKIIVIIDELDRCRPPFAVEILERIKHFFEVPGMVFVLGMNQRQVVNSIQTIYGSGLDGHEYLRRFIHWRYQLPIPDRSVYTELLKQQFDLSSITFPHLDESFNALDPTITQENVLYRFLNATSDVMELTLRQQEQVFTILNLYLRTRDNKDPLYPAALGVLTPIWMQRNAQLNDEQTWGNWFEKLHDQEANNAEIDIKIIDSTLEKIAISVKKPESNDPFFALSELKSWFIRGDQVYSILQMAKNKQADNLPSSSIVAREIFYISHKLEHDFGKLRLARTDTLARRIWDALNDNQQLLE